MRDIEALEAMVGAVLAMQMPSPERIRSEIARVRVVFPSVTDAEAEELAVRFETVHGVTMDLGSTLEGDGFTKWLGEARASIDPYYWNRYRQLLGQKGFSGQVLASLDSVTERTLGLLENPAKVGQWDRRGMVVGHVQSGKTANYTGLICKAADAGYQVIVVIAGIHNNLRSQTQARIDEGFIGFDSAKQFSKKQDEESVVGVGKFDSRRRPNAFTTTIKDFNKSTATGVGIPLENLKTPAVFVIKKNPRTLKSLIEWLIDHNAKRGTKTISAPMLMIDDEADNASINTLNDPDAATVINGQIRRILALFDRSCYVGYTATPFANIFINPDTASAMFGDDLFPRDFIVSLDPPDNYFGATRVFVDEAERVIRHVDDTGDVLPIRHPKTFRVRRLPESLMTAIRTFVVARSVRLARGQTGKHNSMLVNASRFTEVQRQLRNEIHAFVDVIGASVRVNGARPPKVAAEDPEIAALEAVFDREYADSCGLEWDEVFARLHESVSAIDIVEVNSRSTGALDYAGNEKAGLNVIAVGGFSLSRGLTLEGLIVSYFLRNSIMYDTLMQMGRWFGYRPGYDDLCRVWMTEDAEGWYAHVTESIEELRDDLRRMEAASATPEEFGLRVRSHPDTLIVTARNKMGSSEKLVVSIGLANRFIETAIFRREPSVLEANRRAARALAEELRRLGKAPEDGEVIGGGRVVHGVPAAAVLSFLRAFENHPGSVLTDGDPVRRYIAERVVGELGEWDVLFPGIRGETPPNLVDGSLGFDLVCQRRAEGSRSDERTLMITSRQRVSSRGVEKVGLTETQKAAAEEAFRLEKDPPRPADGLNYPDRIYRRLRERPLLVVHMLGIGAEGDDLSASKPVVAWSISFPPTGLDERRVEYVVNTTWFRERYGAETDDEDVDDGE